VKPPVEVGYGGGDRVFGSNQDHEMIFTIPKSKVASVMEGLANTHKAGFRYPVIHDIRNCPNLPPFLEISKDILIPLERRGWKPRKKPHRQLKLF